MHKTYASCNVNALIGCGEITNANVSDESGRTPLHLAAGAFDDTHGELGCLSTVAYLVMKRADVNADDQNGATPLHYASQAGSDLIVMYLVEKDADYNKTDEEGLTPLDYAKREYAKSSSPRHQNVITYFEGKAGWGVLVPQVKYAQIDLAEGIVYMGIKDLDNATAKFTSAIDMCKDDEDCKRTASFLAYWYRGQIYYNQGNCRDAKTDLENFVAQYKLSDENASNQVLKQMYTLAQDWLLACNGG